MVPESRIGNSEGGGNQWGGEEIGSRIVQAQKLPLPASGVFQRGDHLRAAPVVDSGRLEQQALLWIQQRRQDLDGGKTCGQGGVESCQTQPGKRDEQSQQQTATNPDPPAGFTGRLVLALPTQPDDL